MNYETVIANLGAAKASIEAANSEFEFGAAEKHRLWMLEDIVTAEIHRVMRDQDDEIKANRKPLGISEEALNDFSEQK